MVSPALESVPDNLKSDIGAFFVLARSIDPKVKIPNTRSLVSSLQTALILSGEQKYDQLIEYCKTRAQTALQCYVEENWAAGQEECDQVLDDIGFLVYSGYGNMESNAFLIPLEKERKK